jgi:hypothetical protein
LKIVQKNKKIKKIPLSENISLTQCAVDRKCLFTFIAGI